MSILNRRLARALSATLPIEHQMRDAMLAKKKEDRKKKMLERVKESRRPRPHELKLDYRTLRSRPRG